MQAQHNAATISEAMSFAAAKAAVLDGAGVSKIWQSELAEEAALLKQKLGRAAGLAFINIGERQDSELYIRKKREACDKAGIWSDVKTLPGNATQRQLEHLVRDLCQQDHVDGLLLQLPLPSHLDEEAVIDAFDPCKDVDGFHPVNIGRLIMRDRQNSLVPCTALGCMELLKRSDINLKGKEAVLIGDSNVVGTPLAMLLRNSGIAAYTLCSRPSMQATFEDRQNAKRRADAETVCMPSLPGPKLRQKWHETAVSVSDPVEFDLGESQNDSQHQGSTHSSRSPESFDIQTVTRLIDKATQHMKAIITCRRADILVVAVGNPEVVKADWVKPGAVVLDVGINVVPDSKGGHKVVGDVAFDEVSQVAAAITPVPGGLGPMTIAAVLHNTLQAARLHLSSENDVRHPVAARSA